MSFLSDKDFSLKHWNIGELDNNQWFYGTIDSPVWRQMNVNKQYVQFLYRFFSSNSLSTFRLKLGNNCCNSSLTLLRSCIWASKPLRLTKWNVVLLLSWRTTCNCTFGLPSGEIFCTATTTMKWIDWLVNFGNRINGIFQYPVICVYSRLMSWKRCDTATLSRFSAIHAMRSFITYSVPSPFL